MLDVVEFESGHYGLLNNLNGIVLTDTDGQEITFDTVADAIAHGTIMIDSLNDMINSLMARDDGKAYDAVDDSN